jgi:hypothetical protein
VSIFGLEPMNVQLGLVADGINPSLEKQNTHSTWPVLLLNYNLPSWLEIKRFFVMVGLIIPRRWCF